MNKVLGMGQACRVLTDLLKQNILSGVELCHHCIPLLAACTQVQVVNNGCGIWVPQQLWDVPSQDAQNS